MPHAPLDSYIPATPPQTQIDAGMATTAAAAPALAGSEPAEAKHQHKTQLNGSDSADNATLRAAALDCERRVQALLAREPHTKILAGTQRQVRIATGVIDEALDRYG